MPRSKPKVKKLVISNNGNCESMDKCKCLSSDKTSRTNHLIDTPFVVSVFLISFSFPISHCQLLYIIYWDYLQNQLPASKGPSAYFTVCFRAIQVKQRCKLTKRVACAKTLSCEREMLSDLRSQMWLQERQQKEDLRGRVVKVHIYCIRKLSICSSFNIESYVSLQMGT